MQVGKKVNNKMETYQFRKFYEKRKGYQIDQFGFYFGLGWQRLFCEKLSANCSEQ